jgi:nitrogen regulatory protein PII 2
MKEVVAVVRPERREATLEAMRTAGITEVLHVRVMGRGRQQGLQYLRRAQGEQEAGMSYLSKRLVSWLVPDDQVAETVRTLIRVNQTGNHGDGKIFVCPVDEA